MALNRFNKKGVLQRACGVVGIEIERVEVVPLAFKFGAVGNLPTHPNKDVADSIAQHGERVPGTDTFTQWCGGDIDPFSFKLCGSFGGSNFCFACGKCLVDSSSSPADQFAGFFFQLFRHRAHFAVELGERGCFGKVVTSHLLELDGAHSRGDGSQRGLFCRFDRRRGNRVLWRI